MLIHEFGPLADSWVEAGLAAKDATGDPYAVGMEWSGGPVAVLRYMRGLRRALVSIEKNGRPTIPGPVTTNENGQVVARIYPQSIHERIVTPGISVAVWMEPDVSLAELAQSQAVAYRDRELPGKLALVLGAGNVSGIPVNDSLSKLFVENQVVMLKMNPVNEYLGPLIEKGLRALLDGGFLRVVYGGASEGAYLCSHPSVDEIHMTGSDKTYDKIVFGAGADGARRKQEQQALVTKRFTAELGNVAPAIVVPGPWSQNDIAYQAEELVSHLCDNAGYSCSRTRVIIQHSDWPQRVELLDGIRSVLAKTPPRSAYYPGAIEQYGQFLSTHPQAERYGSPSEGELPWAFIPGLNPDRYGDICLSTESFCPVLSETALQASSPVDFLDRAVEYANNHIWGTLSAAIIVHPNSLKNPDMLEALNRAISRLCYGVVTINCIPGLAWVLTSPPWGSFPGNKPWDIQSGTGFVHNSFMFSKPEKTVVRAPFRTWPRPIWFPSQARAFAEVTRRVASYEREPSMRRLAGIVWAAVRT
jgi:acyl-CoA reductase-like NAD-dependent aldehyde dehydrogenase